jgi:hypothetical protein
MAWVLDAAGDFLDLALECCWALVLFCKLVNKVSPKSKKNPGRMRIMVE